MCIKALKQGRHLVNAQEGDLLPWLGSSVGSRVILIHQGCGFDPWSRYIEDSTNECINKWNNKSMFFSLSKKKSINKKYFKTMRTVVVVIVFC